MALQMLKRAIDQKKLNLFCLPYAGGGSAIFHDWKEYLKDVATVKPLLLPGRERRINEIPPDNTQDLALNIFQEMSLGLEEPWAIFGHSMGASLAWEIAVIADKHNHIQNPKLLITSGRASPDLERLKKPIHSLPNGEFIEKLKELGGTPKAVLDNQEMMDLLLPILRGDFKRSETWEPTSHILQSTPILSFGGTKDDESTLNRITPWASYTKSWHKNCLIPGGHFYISEQRALLLAKLKESLQSL